MLYYTWLSDTTLSTYISDDVPVQELIGLKGLWESGGKERDQEPVSPGGHPSPAQPSGRDEDGLGKFASCLLCEQGRQAMGNRTHRLQLIKVQELTVKALGKKAGR